MTTQRMKNLLQSKSSFKGNACAGVICESNPLRNALRRMHPELCRILESWRQRMTPTAFSDAEGSLVVDLHDARQCTGIVTIPIHDAVVILVSQAEVAQEV